MRKILTFALLAFPAMANAQSIETWGYSKFEGKIHLGNKSFDSTVGGLINIALTFLGILTTVIILFGGFKWMTSYGSSDKVDEAKKIIKAGAIGLIIVLTAYAVSGFVLRQLFENTTGIIVTG